jgi:hypothetical protein
MHILSLGCSDCHSQQEAYIEAAKEQHGPEFDAMHAPLDQVAVYRAGRGKKHGQYLIADGCINTPLTLSDVQASGCRSQNEIRSQRCQQTYPHYGSSQQESEARKILEEKVDSQTEIINCLKEGYAGLALVIFLLLEKCQRFFAFTICLYWAFLQFIAKLHRFISICVVVRIHM